MHRIEPTNIRKNTFSITSNFMLVMFANLPLVGYVCQLATCLPTCHLVMFANLPTCHKNIFLRLGNDIRNVQWYHCRGKNYSFHCLFISRFLDFCYMLGFCVGFMLCNFDLIISCKCEWTIVNHPQVQLPYVFLLFPNICHVLLIDLI